MQNSNREQTHTSTCMKNKTRTRWSTLKLRTRLWRWNRFLRSTWSVTGFTSATEQVFLQQIKLKPILPLCPFWRFFFWYYSWCLTVQSEHFKTTLTTDFFLKQKSLVLKVTVMSFSTTRGRCLTHPSWTATTDLVQMWQEPPAPCGPTDHWGSWSHMDNISFFAVKKKE